MARYIIRASFSAKGCALRLEKMHLVPQERMIYIPANDPSDGAKIVYRSKDGKTSKAFDAMDWPHGEPGCKHSPS